MALILCPECGNTISDKANSCPQCGYPIAASLLGGIVEIKIPVRDTGHVTIRDAQSGKLLWKGKTGEIAEFSVKEATDISVRFDSYLNIKMTCDSVRVFGGRHYIIRYIDERTARYKDLTKYVDVT